MSFARVIWRLLVGVKDVLVLIFMLLFFGVLYVGLRGTPDPVVDGGVLWVDLDGVVVEEPSAQDPIEAALMGSTLGEWRLRDVVAALRQAREDDRIEAVALDLDGFLGGGTAALSLVADELEAIREEGKPVIAFATGYSDDAYHLASHASEIWLNPLGAVAFAGPGGNTLYYGEFFDRIGVTANVYRAGTYKSATEPYTLSAMSPEAREDRERLARAMLGHWREDVEAARPAAQMELALMNPLGMIEAAGGNVSEAAVRAGLVDTLGTRAEWAEKLAEIAGEDREDVFKNTRLENYIASEVDEPDGRVGIVTIAGTLADGTGGEGTAFGSSLADAIEQAHRDDKFDALVVRIDSPGGSVLASERIRQAILAVQEDDIPVVASFANVAASGGYWVAAEADEIFAQPETITGSIGVFAILPSFEGTLEKVGLNADGVATTPLSGEPDLLGGPSDTADAFLQAGVDDVYARFLTLVSQGRGMPVARLEPLAGGRVYDGGEARQIGLIDRFGDLDDAIARAGELAELDDTEVVYITRESDLGWLASLFGASARSDVQADPLAALNPAPRALIEQAIADVERMIDGPVMQARCLECGPGQPVAAKSPRAPTWLGRLLGL